MNYLEYDDLKEHKLSMLIFEKSKSLINGGHAYFKENMDFDIIMEQVVKIYVFFYELTDNKFDILKFKDEFREFKKNSELGKIQITPYIVSGSSTKRTEVFFRGEYSFYVLLLTRLFQIVYKKEIENEEGYFKHVWDFLDMEFRSVNYVSNNYIVVDSVNSIIDNEEIKGVDFREYIMKMVELLKEKVGAEEIESKELEEVDVEELETNGQKIMMMKELGIIDFLIENFMDIDKLNINKLSNILHCYTGIKKSSIQGVLNPIYNKGNSQRNNPYSYEKNIKEVKATLLKLNV